MNVATPAGYSIEDFRARATGRLWRDPLEAALDPSAPPQRDDHLPDPLEGEPPAAPRLAAVLAPVIARPGGATVLLTRRAATLRDHSGQIAFPGGKIDPGEAPDAAALREAREEVGLEARYVEPVGWLAPYLTGTGFRIMPMVAIVDPGFALTINRQEVDEAFETPLSFLMNPANHQRQSREWRGRRRHFYAMPYEGHYIWGATAGILRALYERLYLLMLRAVLEPTALFLSPFIVFAIYLALRARYPLAIEHWSRGRISTLTLIGLVVAVIGMFGVALFAPRGHGVYVPAHIENGELIPGHIE